MICVSVTAEDIANGIARDCYCCPGALAINRAIPGSDANIYRFGLYSLLWIEANGLHIRAPQELQDFAPAFDVGQKVEPFAFELPDQDGSEWRRACRECRDLFDRTELDDEDICEECRSNAKGTQP